MPLKTIYYLKKWGINFDAELENYQHAILADNKGNSIENPTPMHGGTHQEEFLTFKSQALRTMELGSQE